MMFDETHKKRFNFLIIGFKFTRKRVANKFLNAAMCHADAQFPNFLQMINKFDGLFEQ